MASETPSAVFPIAVTEETAQIEIGPRLSILEAVGFKDTCHNLCQTHPELAKLILDFSDTTFIDSSGIGALVSTIKLTDACNIALVVRDVQASVFAAIALQGLDTRLTLETHSNAVATEEKTASLPPTHPSVRSPFKRLLDILGAIVGLGISALVFVPIAIAIKLDSPGPVLFSQTRCGWMGRPFRIWKFRSMCDNAEALKAQVENQIEGPLFKNHNDPRITRVGRFLRRTSLDELPQFWNVLRGEMSLVGTRPVLPDELERYEIPAWQRLDVKPGMTGEWQVNGRSTIARFEDVIRLDLKYQENWSLIYDIQLIFKTFAVLFHKNSGAV
ncbi:sugar transferase [Oxynema aestuarii]|jgi:anti-anti-sigma factor|uniref:STAS domain-containing protein n=1 Tax=Oxynema aestuarii AP17 TaxID=2064643 RepID=A0A6H1TZH6_9CYAN|nr:sugar transferase [Oxynema aestuarii]QIZ71320.1 STAS domain-containing protein [Oxynema aestuarii AP17]RMH76594.1 MAG: STAS domain-containing protein [Cyanobacteria bacterium J007]